MNTTERLDEIEARFDDRQQYEEGSLLRNLTDDRSACDVPALAAALRAVLAVCDEIKPNTFGDSLIEADDIVRAITAALTTEATT